jgi:hypothetical protein
MLLFKANPTFIPDVMDNLTRSLILLIHQILVSPEVAVRLFVKLAVPKNG